jgi:hypothetical protein
MNFYWYNTKESYAKKNISAKKTAPPKTTGISSSDVNERGAKSLEAAASEGSPTNFSLIAYLYAASKTAIGSGG